MILEVTVRGRRQVVETATLEGGLVVRAEGASVPVRLEPVAGAQCWRLVSDGQTVPVRLRDEAGTLFATVGAVRVAVSIRRKLPIPSRRSAASAGADRLEVRAPMPGLVIAVPPASGEEVEAGSVVAIVEAMKMQMEVTSPAAGRIEEVRVRPGQEVAGGHVLVVVRASTGVSPGNDAEGTIERAGR